MRRGSGVGWPAAPVRLTLQKLECSRQAPQTGFYMAKIRVFKAGAAQPTGPYDCCTALQSTRSTRGEGVGLVAERNDSSRTDSPSLGLCWGHLLEY